jgi:hypothetical protein
MQQIGKLEPLYRYLKTISGEPVSAFLKDINTLTKGGHLTQKGEGQVQVNCSQDRENEITSILASLNSPPLCYHMSLQGIDDQMFFLINRVSPETNKTILAMSINGENVPKVEFIEPEAIFRETLLGKSLWTSGMVTTTAEDGTSSTGFIRFMTKVAGDGNRLAIEIDLKSSRTDPFYIGITNAYELNRVASFGPPAKQLFTQLWGR